MLSKFFKLLFKIIGCIAGFVALWFGCALLLPKIKVNADYTATANDVTIYVQTNGVHTDIVMPKQIYLPNSVVSYNWNNLVNDSLFPDVDSSYKYVAIGWGDKGFYLDTPEWKDLKFKTAFNAVFGLGSTAMHVTYYKTMVPDDKRIKELKLSAADYQSLIAQITQNFKLNNNSAQLIKHPNYGVHDNYFEANGHYSLFNTCNVWTGNTLKAANVSMGLWTPLQGGVMDNIP